MENFWREARPAHSEQHDIRERPGAYALPERIDMREVVGDRLDRIEPSEAVRDHLLHRVLAAPCIGAPRPERGGETVLIEL